MIIQRHKNIHFTQQGKAHAASGLVCQDKTFYLEKDGIYIMTLADGAGSREMSHIGAEIVCEVAANVLAENFQTFIQQLERYNKTPKEIADQEQLIKIKILDSNLQELARVTKSNKIDSIKDLASTLLFVATDFQNRYISGHIGDGIIISSFYSMTGTYFTVLSEPENGEESNITYFVTDDRAIDHFRLHHGTFKNLHGIIMMSDGLGEVFYSEHNGVRTDVSQFLEGYKNIPQKEYEKELENAFQKQLRDMSTDDLSINVLLLERVNILESEEAYQKHILNNVYSTDQLFRLSPYSFAVHPSLISPRSDLDTITQVLEVLTYE